MPLTGGAADKYGNRYEGRWTVRCFIEMLEGRADKIWLEPPGELGEGAEFILHRQPYREYHQVKRQRATDYAWNLSALHSSKVLSHFRNRLLGTDGDDHERCVFVSGHSAHPLDELVDRARTAADAEQFEKYFDQGPHLDALLKYWEGLKAQEAWAALKRIYVTTIGEEPLRQWNSERVGVLVDGNPDTVTDVLAQYAFNNVHQELDGDTVLAHLEQRGHTARDWAQGGAAAAIARSASKFSTAARRRSVMGQTLIRPEAQTVCMKLDRGAQRVVVAGGRGTGKSGVAAQIVEDRLAAGWRVLVLRANAFDDGMDPADVGADLGLNVSPTSALAGVAGERKGLLVVDQLDHVALSGPAYHSFECVRVIVESAAVHENLAVVLACRSVDILDDPRIRDLVGDDRRNRVEVGLLDAGTVLQIVDATSLDSSKLTSPQLELLRLPLNLRFFTQALNHPALMSFGSADDLIACWNDEMRQRHG